MSEKKVTVRLVMEGGKVVEAELVGLGSKGKTALGGISGAANEVSKSTGAMRSNVQNAAFQMQDFFVQVSSGTSVSRALGQQLPQLLGSMGLIGVVAGTAAAALIPLIGYLFKGEDQAAAFTKTMDGLANAISQLKSANAAAGTSVADLTKQYGQYSGQAKELLEIQKQIAELAANRAFGAAANAVPGAMDMTGGFGTRSSQELQALAVNITTARDQYDQLTISLQRAENGLTTLTDQQQEDMAVRRAAAEQMLIDNSEYTRAIKDLAGTFGVTEEAAMGLAVAAAKVREADNTQDRVAAARDLATAIWDSSDGLKNANPQAVELYGKLVDAWHAGLDLAAVDIAGTIGAGADEAERLAKALRLSAGMYGRGLPVVATPGMNFPDYAGPNHDIRSPFGSIPSGLGMPGKKDDKTTHGTGGGGVNDQAREAQRIFEATRTEAEKYSAEMANLDALLKSGALSQDTYNRAVDQLAQKYNHATDAAKFFQDINSEIKDSILDLAVNGSSSFDKIAESIKRATFEALLFGDGPFGKMFGGGGGVAGLIGKAIGFKMPSFEGGGFTGRGARSGGLDGRGGFLSLLHPNEVVGDLTRAGRGSSGGTTVQIIDQRQSGAAVQTQMRTGPDGREIIVATIRDAETRGELDRGKRARFGLRPAQVTR